MNTSNLSELKNGAKIYLIGICGTAMASFAGILQDMGFVVSGSDQNVYPPMSLQLEKLKIPVYSPFAAENLRIANPDFVIVGNVVSKNHPEATALKDLGLPFTSMPQALGELVLRKKEMYVVSGTHGKTTTSSLLAWTCQKLGLQPGYLIGGIPKNFGQSFCETKEKTFIIEGDEYDTAFFDKVPKFVHYHPKHVILTSVEFDHADIYRDLEHVKSAFRLLLEKIPANGTLAYHGHDRNIASLLAEKNYPFRKIPYALTKDTDLRQTESGQIFYVKHKNCLEKFELPMSGKHNVLNALGVLSLAFNEEWNLDVVRESFRTFKGVKRRQEILGVYHGVTLIEDFAHHPTAVRETILGVKRQYEGKRIFAVFEPRSATSRRKIFQKDYIEALSEADFIHLARAHDQSKIAEEERFSSDELVQDLTERGKSAASFSSAGDIAKDISQKTRPGDVVLVMSNGAFDGIYQKLIDCL